MKVLITGAAGYIGSHTIVQLLDAGYRVVGLDNFSNSKPEVINRIRKITGHQFEICNVDLLNKPSLDKVFEAHSDVTSVIHFAGLKSVAESIEVPVRYYRNNIIGTLNLLDVMSQRGVRKLIFSSSATVYSESRLMPVTERSPIGATKNPYGMSKYLIEQILRDLYGNEPDWNITIFRYFNPVGAHESGLIGEDPAGIPCNLVPSIGSVAVGRTDEFTVFGSDYDTRDGTAIRDYIHVMDLARGHICAVDTLMNKSSDFATYNLGTGRGYSVLEVLDRFETVSNLGIPRTFQPRRKGDVAECWADASLVHKHLNWLPEYDLDSMLSDYWRWQSQNPNGYV